MNTLGPIILWSAILLLLLTGVVFALLASRHLEDKTRSNRWLLIPVVALVVVTILFAALGGWRSSPSPPFHVAASTLLLIIGVVGGSPLAVAVLRWAKRKGRKVSNDSVSSSGIPDVDGVTGTDEEAHGLRGGRTIGYLERLAVIGAALLGQFAAVALVVAIKGLGRYPEMKDTAFAERFIIGTLVSIVWAGACVAPAINGG